MIWSWFDTWIVITGVLCALSCALLGSFLVLRKMSMMGDAISHAVLPGIVVAFLISESRASLPMFLGAAIVGVLTAVLTQWVSRSGKVEESASMGVVFTGLFALGLVMIRVAADTQSVDLDPGCVLYGALEMTPLDTLQFSDPRTLLGYEWSGEIPRPVLVLGAVLVLNLVCVGFFYKELKITCFDPALATTLGIPAWFMHYLLMTLVAITTVASFESVGSILVVAMLIVPAAAAHLLTNRLPAMLAVSCGIGALSAVMGHLGATTIPTALGYPDTRIAGMMAVSAGLILTLAVVFSPTHGVAVKYLRRLALSQHIAEEDILGVLYRVEENASTNGSRTPRMNKPGTSLAVLRAILDAGPVRLRLALRKLHARGQVQLADDGYTLTDAGRSQASQIIRTHRLWESYLARHLGLPSDHVHTTAEKMEHIRTDAVVAPLVEAVDANRPDPQGKPIPPKE